MKVIWTLRALKTYLKVSDYLQHEWGNTVLRNFTLDVERIIREIAENPYMFEGSKKYHHVRKGFLTEHNTIFYRIMPKKKMIEILIFGITVKTINGNPFSKQFFLLEYTIDGMYPLTFPSVAASSLLRGFYLQQNMKLFPYRLTHHSGIFSNLEIPYPIPHYC